MPRKTSPMNVAPPALTHPPYRADIDGLRALAVLAVVIYHAFPTKLQGGFVGVDIFFVISGYLISTIIFSNLANNTFHFSTFYIRRVKRIFPALALVLSATLIMGWLVLLTDEFKQLNRHISSGTVFVSNFILWGESGYFDSSAEKKPLLHLWSLGIEEQFYIVWPFLAWLSWQYQKRVLPLLLVSLALSFALNLYWVSHDTTAAFYSPLTRFWELAAGSLLAYLITQRHLVPNRFTAVQSHIMATVGLGLLLGALLLLDNDQPFPGWRATFPVIGTFLVILAGNQAWLNRHILSHKVMVWFGLISYPLYLWHWPLFSFAYLIDDKMHDNKTLKITLILIAIALATLTYRYLEKPIRRSNHNRAVIPLLTIMALLGGLSWAIAHHDGWGQTPLSGKIDPEIIRAKQDWEPPTGLIEDKSSPLSIFSSPTGQPEVVLFGDSHIDQYAPRALLLAHQGRTKPFTLITGGGCPPIPHVHEDKHPNCRHMITTLKRYLDATPSVTTVLIGACWNCYFIEQTNPTPPEQSSYHYYYQQGAETASFRYGDGKARALQALIDFVTQLSQRYRVFVLLDNPIGEAFDPGKMLPPGVNNRWDLVLASGTTQPTSLKPQTFAQDPQQTALEAEMQQLLANTRATLISQSQYICPAGLCSSVDANGKPIYQDNNHIRPFYIRERMDVIDPVLLRD